MGIIIIIAGTHCLNLKYYMTKNYDHLLALYEAHIIKEHTYSYVQTNKNSQNTNMEL